MQKENIVNQKVPTGRFIASYEKEFEIDNCIGVNFIITVGSFKDERVTTIISTQKAKSAIRQRSGGWIEWMAYSGDATANKITDAIRNSVADQFFIDLDAGIVKNIIDPTRTERIYKSFIKALSVTWQISSEPGNAISNLNSCKLYLKTMGLLPKTWGYNSGELELRTWLNEVTNPSSELYLHEAAVWINEIYVSLGGIYEKTLKRDWPPILKNNGFDRPPKPPRKTKS